MSSTNPVNAGALPNSDQSDIDRANEAIQNIYTEFNTAFALEEIIEQDSGDIAEDNAELAQVQEALNELKEQGIDVDTNIADYQNADDLYAQVSAAINKAYPKSYNIPYNIEVLWGDCDVRTPSEYKNPTQGDAALQDLFVKQGEVNKAEAEMVSIDPEIQDLLNEINTLMHSLGQGGVSQKFITQDLATLMQILTPLFEALKDRLQADEDRQLIVAGGAAGWSDSDLAKLYLDAIGAGLSEQNTLLSLDDTMAAADREWRETENHADEEMKNFDWWTHVKSFGNDEQKEYEVRQVRKNAQMMEKILQNLMKGISSEIGSFSSGFSEIGMMLDLIMHDVNKVWNSDLPFKEKQKEILGDLGMVLSLLSAIQSQVATDRAGFDKRIAEAMQNASLISVEDSISQQKQMDNLRHAQSVMKKVMFSAKVIMSVASYALAAASGGALAPLAVIALSGLDLSGGVNGRSVLDKGTDQLAMKLDEVLHSKSEKNAHKDDPFYVDKGPSKTARILAEVIMGVSQALFFAGASIGDEEISAAMAVTEASEASMKAAIVSAEAEIKVAIQVAVENAQRSGAIITEEQIENATRILTQRAEQTADLVLKKTGHMLMRSGALGDLIKLSQGAYTPALEAAQNAAKESLRELEILAKTALKNPSLAEILGGQANEAANRALADQFKLTEKEISDATSNIGQNIAKRSGYMAVYTLSNSNFLLDTVQKLMEDSGRKEGDKVFDAIQNLIRALQAIISMIGMMGAAGGSGALNGGLPLWASRLTTVSQVAGTGTTGVAEGSLARTSEKQAQMIPKIAKDKASIDAFQLMLKQLFQSEKSEQDGFSKEAAAVYESSSRVIQKGLVNNDDIWRVLSSPA